MKLTQLPVEDEKYPLYPDDINKGQFAECENGTIVIRTDLVHNFEEEPYNQLVNILNGLGGYTPDSKFRVLKNYKVEFEINSYGEGA